MDTSFECATQQQFPLKFCGVGTESTCEAMNYAVSVTPKFTATLSILGVSLIIYRFFKTPRKDRKAHDRLLLGMSMMNFWGSIGFFIGQWTFPDIQTGDPSSSTFCNWQGWLLQINSAVFWYNSVLATVFVLKIHFLWSEDKVARVEPLLHGIAWAYPVITSFVALGLKLYSSAGPWCWISVQNDWARWALFFSVLWLCMIYSACCMILIVVIVKRSDDRTLGLRDVGSPKGRQNRKVGNKTRQVALQATLYIAMFLLTWIFGTANRIQNAISRTTATQCAVFALMWLHSFFVPLQGFGNFLVYIYPRIKDAKTEAKLLRRQRAITKTTLSRAETVRAFGVSAYRVVLGSGAILTPSQVTQDSSTPNDSIPLDSEGKADQSLDVSKVDPRSSKSEAGDVSETL